MTEESDLEVVQQVITQEMVSAYADASGDRNPIHLDPDFASSSQFGAIVAHGMLTLALIAQMLTQTFGPRWMETGVLKVRFRGPAYIGDRVATWGKVVREVIEGEGRRVECFVGLKNQNGDELIGGTASVLLPPSDS